MIKEATMSNEIENLIKLKKYKVGDTVLTVGPLTMNQMLELRPLQEKMMKVEETADVDIQIALICEMVVLILKPFNSTITKEYVQANLPITSCNKLIQEAMGTE